MSDRKPSPIDNARKSKRRKQDDSGLQKPKRPLSAYNLFFRDERTRYLEERAANNGQDTSGKSPFLAMSAEISKRWMCLPSEQRHKYNILAEEETIKYHVKVDAFKEKQRAREHPGEANRGPQESSHGLTNESILHRDEDQKGISHFPSNQYPVGSSLSASRSGDQTAFAQSEMMPSSLLSQQQQQMASNALSLGSMNRENNMMLHQLLQRQLESSSSLQASLQQQLLQLSTPQDHARWDFASLRTDAPREAMMPQDNAALMRSVLNQQEQYTQQQLIGLAQYTDLIDRELHRRIAMYSQLGSPSRNPILQGQGRAASFRIGSGATDVSNDALSSQASSLLQSDRFTSSQAGQGSAFQGRFSSGGEAKEASPVRHQIGSTAGLLASTGDDFLLRLLLANQTQSSPAVANNLMIPSGSGSAFARPQDVINQNSQLIAALTQGWRAANADEHQEDPPSPSSS